MKRAKIGFFLFIFCSHQDVYAFQLFNLLSKMNQEARNLIFFRKKNKQQAIENGVDIKDGASNNRDNQNYSGLAGSDPGLTRSPKMPQEGQNNDSVRVYFKDIVGIESVLVEVTEVVDYLRFSEIYKKLGARMPRGILLEGPPGNGKTMIAKAIANEANCSFIHASGSSFIEMYVGVGAARVRDLFAQARLRKPSIIFIDEFDAVAGVHRSALTGGGGDQEAKQTINQLLTELDGFSTDDSVIVIAATNDAQSLDPAVKRSGRFDRLIHVPLPDEPARKKLLSHYLGKLPRLGDDISEILPEKIAKETEGLCAADFKNMVNEMAIFAVRERSEAVFSRHVIAGAEKVITQRKGFIQKTSFHDIFRKN